jgi:DNA repair protein RecN (Recombination protein N)
LAAEVETALRRLAMPHATIAIDVGEHENDHPGDHVRFLLAANPGMPLLPLTRVASGGELARAMLALRLVLSHASASSGDTLVFDEVDAGIGGAAAIAVAEALTDLSRTHQVLVVTHLPQVAARADTHVVVTKSTRHDRTDAAADAVDGEARIDEIARMLSGTSSESAREHARELLQNLR